MADEHDHDHENGHECDLCGQSFDTEEELQEHAQEEHQEEM